MISLSNARTHLRLSGRRHLRHPEDGSTSASSSLDAADVAQLALLLTRSSGDAPAPRLADLDAYYGSERDADRL